MDFDYKMVIVTRKDLKLSLGKLCAQVGHAAVNCAMKTKKDNSKWYSKWNSEGAKKVVVRVDSLDDFYFLKEAAEAQKIATSLISDAGHTEIAAGTVTVLGLGPAPNSIIDQITGDLSLL